MDRLGACACACACACGVAASNTGLQLLTHILRPHLVSGKRTRQRPSASAAASAAAGESARRNLSSEVRASSCAHRAVARCLSCAAEPPLPPCSGAWAGSTTGAPASTVVGSSDGAAGGGSTARCCATGVAGAVLAWPAFSGWEGETAVAGTASAAAESGVVAPAAASPARSA